MTYTDPGAGLVGVGEAGALLDEIGVDDAEEDTEDGGGVGVTEELAEVGVVESEELEGGGNWLSELETTPDELAMEEFGALDELPVSPGVAEGASSRAASEKENERGTSATCEESELTQTREVQPLGTNRRLPMRETSSVCPRSCIDYVGILKERQSQDGEKECLPQGQHGTRNERGKSGTKLEPERYKRTYLHLYIKASALEFGGSKEIVSVPK